MKIITGSTGKKHITSNNDGEFNQAIFGSGLIVLGNGEQLDATIVDNNTIRIKDGDIVMQGRHALIEPGNVEDITISTGSVGNNRIDLIVARYQMDVVTGYESITLEVLEGEESSGEAIAPQYTTGVIRTGSLIAEHPLYQVNIEGINIVNITKLFNVTEDLLGRIQKNEKEIAQTNSNLTELESKSYNKISVYGPVTSDDKTYINFQNVQSGYRVPALFVGNANGVPAFRYCALFSNNDLLSCAISAGAITATANEDGTRDVKITDVAQWGYYYLMVFY